MVIKKFLFVIFILFLSIGTSDAQLFHKNALRKAEKKQEAKDKKLKSDYEKSIRRSQKRTIDIQTPVHRIFL